MITLQLDWRPFSDEADALGESPFWLPHENALHWVDIAGRRLRRRFADGREASWSMPQEPGCFAPMQGGGYVIALRDGVYRAAAWEAPLQRVADAPYDPAVMRFNDGKADPLGRFWAGGLYEPRTEPLAKLHCFDLRGGDAVVTEMAGDATVANGLAWSPDARTLYWADTTSHSIHAWDWDAQRNSMQGERLMHRFPPKPAGWQPGMAGYGGRPDGAAVDTDGNYWCAMFEGGRLLKLSPAGDVLVEMPVPLRCPTMPCFGGDDLRTLYVTSARHHRPAEEVAEFPWTGRVIAARVDVPGLPVNFVIG